MATYTVIWKIEIDAETPLEAAVEARAIQLDSESEALFFEVEDSLGKTTDVDVTDEIWKKECKQCQSQLFTKKTR